MSKPKKKNKVKIKYLYNGIWDNGPFVLAWNEGRSDICVQVWNSGKLEGEPDGDWAMPRLLGTNTAIAQAVLQSR